MRIPTKPRIWEVDLTSGILCNSTCYWWILVVCKNWKSFEVSSIPDTLRIYSITKEIQCDRGVAVCWFFYEAIALGSKQQRYDCRKTKAWWHLGMTRVGCRSCPLEIDPRSNMNPCLVQYCGHQEYFFVEGQPVGKEIDRMYDPSLSRHQDKESTRLVANQWNSCDDSLENR